jgi:hypothetical protein
VIRHFGLPTGLRDTLIAFNSPRRIQPKTVCSPTANLSQISLIP